MRPRGQETQTAERRQPSGAGGGRYVPVELHAIKPGTSPGFDLYRRVGNDFLLYCPHDEPIDGSIWEKLAEGGARHFYVDSGDRGALLEFLAGNLQGLLSDPAIGSEGKARIVYDVCLRKIETIYQEPKAAVIEAGKETMRQTVDYILSCNDQALDQMIRLLSHDDDTYHHCVEVGLLGVTLSRKVFGRRDEDLYEVGYGMFLHDIGKTRISLDVLNKPGPLDEREWEIMRSHPRKGYEILEEEGHLTREARIIVMQHHERCNGQGYPKGLSSSQIDPLGKVCNIVDSFDALISRRAYKDALRPYEALRIMKTEMEGAFDRALFREFVLLLR